MEAIAFSPTLQTADDDGCIQPNHSLQRRIGEEETLELLESKGLSKSRCLVPAQEHGSPIEDPAVYGGLFHVASA